MLPWQLSCFVVVILATWPASMETYIMWPGIVNCTLSCNIIFLDDIDVNDILDELSAYVNN